VADAVLCKLAGPLTMPLSKIQRLPLRAFRLQRSETREARCVAPRRPGTVRNVRSFFVLARLLYEDHPRQAVTQTPALLDYLPAILQPGVRAGEEKLGKPEKEVLSKCFREHGDKWFDDLRALLL